MRTNGSCCVAAFAPGQGYRKTGRHRRRTYRLGCRAGDSRAEIKPPTFPDRDFSVTDHGAVGDGTTDCRPAFDKAIAACHEAGGGRVVVPAGDWLVNGPIHLKSNVNLHLAEGATVRFSTDPADYLPAVFTRFEGNEVMNFSPFIYAFEQENIAITGAGHVRRPGRSRSTGGPGKAPATQIQNALRADGRRQRAGRASASSAPATNCGRTSSSPIAARTC